MVTASIGVIESCAVSTNHVDDAAMVTTLLDKIEAKGSKVAAGCAYHKNKVYWEVAKTKIQPVLPAVQGARISWQGNCSGRQLPRDKTIRQIKKPGKKQWKIKQAITGEALQDLLSFGSRPSLESDLPPEVWYRRK